MTHRAGRRPRHARAFPDGHRAGSATSERRPSQRRADPDLPGDDQGTTAEATVERLDPQISQCGRIESTVWYRIDQAPDGTIVLGVRGAGFAPVIRSYRLGRNGIAELDCASATAGARARGRRASAPSASARAAAATCSCS